MRHIGKLHLGWPAAGSRVLHDPLQLHHRIAVGLRNVAAASAQFAQGNQHLSQRTQEHAAAREDTALAAEQLGSVVREKADNARTANRLAQAATNAGGRGEQAVREVV